MFCIYMAPLVKLHLVLAGLFMGNFHWYRLGWTAGYIDLSGYPGFLARSLVWEGVCLSLPLGVVNSPSKYSIVIRSTEYV